MDVLTLLLLALGLATDAFAVSISNNMCYTGLTRRQVLASCVSFGLFQGIMPVVGYFAGRLFEPVISRVDHWVALVLLGFIGGKMVVEGIRALRGPGGCEEKQAYTTKAMLVQALATSIDALAVGISFSALAVNIFTASLTIALITFVCCLAGAALGKRFGMLLGDWAQIFGGLLLVGIGIKVFLEHTLGG